MFYLYGWWKQGSAPEKPRDHLQIAERPSHARLERKKAQAGRELTATEFVGGYWIIVKR